MKRESFEEAYPLYMRLGFLEKIVCENSPGLLESKIKEKLSDISISHPTDHSSHFHLSNSRYTNNVLTPEQLDHVAFTITAFIEKNTKEAKREFEKFKPE